MLFFATIQMTKILYIPFFFVHTDMRMFPMLECLSSVLCAIGLDAQQYVMHVYSRCLRIITTVLKEHADAGAILHGRNFAYCC